MEEMKEDQDAYQDLKGHLDAYDKCRNQKSVFNFGQSASTLDSKTVPRLYEIH